MNKSDYSESHGLIALEAAAREAGVCLYMLPSQVTDEHVDPMLRNIVRRINATGWVITGESCEGHPDDKDAWAGNTRPMLRLACRLIDSDRLLGVLGRVIASMNDDAVGAPGNATVPFLGLSLWPRIYPGWFEVLVYVEPGSTFWARDRGIEAFDYLAGQLEASNAR